MDKEGGRQSSSELCIQVISKDNSLRRGILHVQPFCTLN